ncbi:unnamed protein product [Lymnaea stagnalis]|uniref:Major facilitator superfamily (MFS) profile domain-containing protein n=1 Tax=Lymnaea stagnalis TaxID=6523 RepID=A0AAV2HM30_LYMST
MFVVGMLVGGFCAILFGTLDKCPPGTPFIIVCFACRCIEALGLSAFITAGFAIISNEFPNHVATVFALLETADGIGLMAGPAMGGALYELGGFGLPFFVIGSLILATGVSMLLFLPQPQNRHEERKVSIFSLLKSPMIWFTGQAIVVASIGILFLDPTLSKHLQQFDLSTAVIGLIFVISPGLYGLTSPIWGYISDSKKLRGSLIFLGNLMCGIAFLFIGPSPYLPFLPDELWVIIVGLVIVGIFISLAVVPTMNCLLIGATELGFEDNLDTYGVIAGLFNSIFCLGSFTGPMLGGILIEELGFRYGATVISGIYFFVMFSCGSYFLYRFLSERSTKPGILSVHYESIKSADDDANNLTEDSPVV